jgi:tetratricopeptide (TPR) repeat protein
VRWRIPVAAIALILVTRAATPARGDWKVRRSSPGSVARRSPAPVVPAKGVIGEPRAARESTAGQPVRAIERLRQRVVAHPDVRTHSALAKALLADGRVAEAVERFSDAIAAEPSAVAPRLGRARALVRAGQIRQAAADYRAVLSMGRGRSADRLASARELIEAAIAGGDADTEIEGRRAWVELRPGPEATEKLAAALARGGRFREAATTVAAVGSGAGQRAAARRAFDEGRYWAAADDLERAVGALERARQLAPRAAGNLRRDIFASLVDVSRRRGTLDVLSRELDRPRDAVEWVARATVAREQGDSRGVWTSLNEAIRQRPFDIDLHRRRIEAARRVASGGELARLYELFAEVAIRANDGVSMGEALDELWRLGRQDGAARIVDRVLARPGANAQLVRVAAELAGRWGDDRRAERGWQVLLRHDPRDEAIIVSLGEVRLQRGDRRGALESWRALLRSSAGRPEGHVRLAETLADHEFADAAVEEARAAIAMAPRQGRPRRVLAGILERQGKRREAEEAWEDVLMLTRSASDMAERREARIHLVNLWIREGAGRTATKVAELEEHLRGQADDVEVRLCLIELYLRMERLDGAMAQLTQAWGQPAPVGQLDSSPAASARHDVASSVVESSVEQVFTLIRLLRQRQRTAEAMSWLEAVAARFPARARDVRLQLADMAVAAHDDERAAIFASAAVEAAPDDPTVSLRAAAVEERLGHLAAAAAAYRRVISANPDAAGRVALAALMSRTGGEPAEQRSLLRWVLARGTDDDLVSEAGRRSIALEEALGSLDELARELWDTGDLNASHVGGAARRRVLALILTRLVPTVYRSRDQHPSAAARLRRYGRDGVRPLLDLANGAEGEADVAAIDALGMLGRSEVAPELARLLIADDAPLAADGKGQESTATARTIQLRTNSSDVARAIIVALGRLGGEAARTTLESVAKVPRPGLETALLWSLGRVGSTLGAELAARELAHSSADASLIACLTLGRVGGREAAATLWGMAADPGRASRLRAAAILGMVLGRVPLAMANLRQLVAGEAGVVSDTARGGMAALQGSGGAIPPDEAPLILGSIIDPPALIRDMAEAMAGRHPPAGQQPP